MTKNPTTTSNVSFVNSGILTVMFIVFLTLKLTGNIDWSWWWVTSPLWLPLVLVFGLVILLLIFGIILLHRGRKKQKPNQKD